MSLPKTSPQDRERFEALVPRAPEVLVKPMFGNIAAFVGGHMFMGSFGTDIGVKLAEPDRARLAELPGTGPFGPAERPMSGYVSLPAHWQREDAEPWVALAFEQAAALPPKAGKPPKAPKPAKAGGGRPRRGAGAG